MEAIPQLARLVGPARLEQPGIGECLDEFVGQLDRCVEQGTRHPGREVGDVEAAEQLEEPLGLSGQALIAHRQTRTYGKITGDELVEPAALVGETAGEPGERPVWASSQPGGGDPQRKGQMSAELGDLVRRRKLLGDPRGADDLGQQVGGGLFVEHVQVDVLGTLECNEAAATGDEDGTRRASG